MFSIFLCYILLIQLSNSVTVPEYLQSNYTLPNKSLKETKVPIVSEGGPIISNDTLIEKNHTNLINLEKEFGKGTGKSVVPRKGVVYIPREEKETTENDIMVTKNVSSTDTFVLKNIQTPYTTLKNSNPNNSNVTLNDTLKSPIVHKPLILSYEALSQMDKINNIVINENEPNLKVHALKSSSHPGMIMPIVITILVVPMFAVVGYMALKRGKEAWKNRHYKRMDFLLDGMYND